MYETIGEWLAENPEEYDFREQIVDFKPEEDAIERFFAYKAIGIAETKKPGYLSYVEAQDIYKKHNILVPKGEADSCLLVLEILKELGSVSHAADTMNSCLTTVMEALKPSSGRFVTDSDCKKAKWGNQKTVWLYYHNKQDIRKLLAAAERFLKLSYTIGNFVPCPNGCNRPMTKTIEDYWDLTLWCIHRWYNGEDEGKEEALKKLFGEGDNQSVHRLTYGEWLAKFGTWDDFVEKNYLQDYTEWDQRPYGRPKEFWDGHFEGPALPQTPEQIEAFFTRAAQCIEARSQRMVAALKEKPKK